MKTATTVKPFSILDLTVTGALGVLGGIWYIAAPFVLNYDTYTPKVSADNATLMSIILGVVAIVLSVFAIITEKMPQFRNIRIGAGIGLIAVGVLSMAAPYLFNYPKLRDPLYVFQITGIAFIIIAGFVVEELVARYKAEQ